MSKLIKTACIRDCPNTCSLLAKVEGQRVVSLTGDPEAPTNQGRVCRKCQGYVARAYDPERLLYPLIKSHGQFTRASWATALDLVADKIKELLAADPSKILYYQGFGSRTALKLLNRRFFNLLGPVSITKGTICGGAGQGAQDLDYGARISHDIRDHLNSRLLVLWGRNPIVTSLNLLPVIKKLKEEGKEVVLIDPVHTESVPLATFCLAPRPGSDSQLALALARLVFEAKAEDLDFLTNHCEGFEAYRKIVFQEDLTARAKATDLDPQDIVKLAELMMAHKPVALVLGWGLHRWRHSHITIRAIDGLGAVLGSIGAVGGGVSQGFEEYQPYDWAIWGDEAWPNRRKLYMPLLGEELEKADPPVEMIMITAGNPAAMLPDSSRVRKAIARIPFKVVGGHFLDDTAALADVFLPATSFLEEDDVVASYGHSYICPINKAIPPLGEARSDFDLFMDLGARFGLTDYVKPRDEWLRLILAPTIKMGVSLETIQAGGAYQPDIPHAPFQDKVFPTPTGKFNLLTEYEDPAIFDPERRFALLSVSPKEWLCSEIRPGERVKVLWVKVNAEVAQELGFTEDELVLVKSSVGQLKATVKLEPKLRKDLVVIPRGGWAMDGCDVNVLTRAVLTKVGSGTAYYQTRVNLEKF
ncbi:MAG: molybdopterin-dependent oxidoreductase [Deltaproteobacteria bacterium]|jgi:anaerobic selenocysteine-containing dehydrogenase|nr:molybdopterin-dependent oxidoreductase [Deltaproteobacteria bacterium]